MNNDITHTRNDESRNGEPEALRSSECDANFRAMRARVVAVHKDRWEILPEEDAEAGPSAPDGEARPALRSALSATLAGRFRHEANNPADLPVVGDWVEAEWARDYTSALIRAVKPRKGLLARKRPGDIDTDAVVEQPIAANVDLALLAMGVDEDFSVRRLERYLTLSWDAGAKPVVVLTKADLAGTAEWPGIDERIAEAQAVTFGAAVIATSARTGEGVEELRGTLKPGLCAILLGSSGVGKSTLLNALAGTDLQKTAEVRSFDGKGRHTTTSRRLVELPWGAYLVDTPGVREIQLWGDEDSLSGSFPDVEALAAGCRFSDCAHENEPGCAVRGAVENGTLDAVRLESWHRLRRELAYLERKADTTAARAEKEKWKSIAKLVKNMYREQGR